MPLINIAKVNGPSKGKSDKEKSNWIDAKTTRGDNLTITYENGELEIYNEAGKTYKFDKKVSKDIIQLLKRGE